MIKHFGYIVAFLLLTVPFQFTPAVNAQTTQPQTCPQPPAPVVDVIPDPLPTVSQLEDAVNNFYTAYEQRQIDVIAKSVSGYYLQANNQQLSDVIASFRKDDFDGFRVLAHTILKETKVSDITYIVSLELRTMVVTPTQQPTELSPQSTGVLSSFSKVLYQQDTTQNERRDVAFRFENGVWKMNGNLVDYFPQAVKPQTISGVTIQPETLVRFTDKTRLVFCVKNTNAKKILWTFGQPSATFYFGSNQVTTPSHDSSPITYEPQSVDSSSTVSIRGFSSMYPTAIDLRSWHFTDEAGRLPSDYGAGWTYKFKLQLPKPVVQSTPTATPRS